MSKKLILSLALATFVLGAVQIANTQENSGPSERQKKAMRAMKLAKPGPEHKLLEQLVGDWDVETKMWMSADSDPMSFPGNSSAKMKLGGRYLYGDFTTDAGHMKGEGIYIIGFDRRHETFNYTDFNTWGTNALSATGKYNEETKSITMYGEDSDPIMESTQKHNFVITFLTDDSWKFEVIYLDKDHTQGEDQFKAIEVTYTRAK